MSRIAKILGTGLLWLYIPLLLIIVFAGNRGKTYDQISVIVSDSLRSNFVSATAIRESVLNQFPDLIGTRMRDVNLLEIESFVNERSFVRDAHVFSSPSGTLNIKIFQYHPILRVFDDDRTFYLDEHGTRIPVSRRYTARVLVANGNIPKNLDELLNVARIVHEDPFWRAQMKQIYIRRNNDYVLVPRVGDHLILLGKPVRVEEKLRNLKALYKNGLDPLEWNEFKLINLKFEGQVICSRSRDF